MYIWVAYFVLENYGNAILCCFYDFHHFVI